MVVFYKKNPHLPSKQENKEEEAESTWIKARSLI
jgi:hypothetical protein